MNSSKNKLNSKISWQKLCQTHTEYKYVAIYLETLEDFEIQGTPQTIVDFEVTVCLLDIADVETIAKWDEIIFLLSINGADA